MAPECCAADYWVASFDSGGTFRLALRLGWTASLVAAMAPEWGIEDPTLDELRQAFLDARAADADRRSARPSGSPGRRPSRSSTTCTGPGRSRTTSCGTAGPPGWTRSSTTRAGTTPTGAGSIPRRHYGALDLPAVHVGGWYDIHLAGILQNFTGMQRQAPTERARRAQRLVVGPVGPLDPDAVGRRRRRLRAGGGPGHDPAAPGLVPALAAGRAPSRAGRRYASSSWAPNTWRDEQEWPLARTVYTPWYLGRDGGLGPEAPGDRRGARRRLPTIPRDPVPTLGGRLLGSGEVAGPARPASDSAERPDVLVYTSERSGRKPMELTGPVRVELWAATDAPDTDFTAVLDRRASRTAGRGTSAKEPSGPATAAHRAVGAGRRVPLHRSTWSRPAWSVPAGHRLRLHVSSSSFPEWEPNPNTGRPVGMDTDADLAPPTSRSSTTPVIPAR